MDNQELQITLTQNQKKIFDKFLHYKQQLQLKTVFRVAGGWVRDKLLGKVSHDIDIALDDMKGQQFVTKIKKYSQSKNEKLSGCGVTKANPELGKHLQTATIKLFDQFLDIVNLRSQKFIESQGLSKEDIGTAKQDAQRRDFTVNSLFYNINTGKVQDWTNKGIEDLKKGLIRTPLNPKITFKDDPLRIFRCFRFAARFNFKVSEQILECLSDPQVIYPLQNKISRERVGTELTGILKTANPLLGLRYIYDYNLWNIMFKIPAETTLEDENIVKGIPKISISYLKQFIDSIGQYKLITEKDLILVEEQQQTKQQEKKKEKIALKYQENQLKISMYLSCLTFIYYSYQKISKKTKDNLLEVMIKQQLKLPAKFAKFALKVAQNIQNYKKITSIDDRNNIVRWLRFSQQKWQITLHQIYAISQVTSQPQKIHPMELRQYIIKMNWNKVFLTDSFIDGNFLIKIGKKGPILKIILENTAIWRILNSDKNKQQFLKIYQTNKQFFQDENTYT